MDCCRVMLKFVLSYHDVLCCNFFLHAAYNSYSGVQLSEMCVHMCTQRTISVYVINSTLTYKDINLPSKTRDKETQRRKGNNTALAYKPREDDPAHHG